VSAYLSFEWLKFSKRWMPRIILGLVVGATFVAFWAQGSRVFLRDDLFLPRGWLAALDFCSRFAPFFWPVLGGIWAGNEYGWGTIRAALTRRPNRIGQVAAPLIVMLACVAIGIVSTVLAGTIGGLAASGLTGNAAWVNGVWNGDFLTLLLKGALTAWYVSAFYLILAYAAAIIFRSAAIGLAVGLGGTLAQAVLIRFFVDLGGNWETIGLHFPYNYANTMITQVVGAGFAPGSRLAATSSTDPTAAQSLAALAIYGGICLVLTAVAVRTRDVTA